MEEEVASFGRVHKQTGSYTFRIEGYSGLSSAVGVSTESPEFRLCGHCWQLRIFPGGSLEAHKNFVSYYLASKSTRQARASYKLSVKCQKVDGSDETFSSSGVRVFEAKGTQIDGWGRDKFMPISNLNDPILGYYVNDIVIFKVEITVFGSLLTCDIPIVSKRTLNHSNITLSECMYALYHEARVGEAESSADLRILAGESQTPIYCHRYVLCARSPVFKAMLSSQHGHSPKACTNFPLMASDDIHEERIRTTTSSVNSDRSKIFNTALSAQSDSDTDNSQSDHWSHATSGGEDEEPEPAGEPERESKGIYGQTIESVYTARGANATEEHEVTRVRPGGGDDAIEFSQESKDDFLHHASYQRKSVRRIINVIKQESAGTGGVHFLEAGLGTIHMPDIEPSAVLELLTFIYTDALSSMTVLEAMAVQLFVAAAKYQVTKLMSIVEDYLCLQVALETAVPLLQVANAYDAIKLRNRCLQCIIDNAAEVVKLKEYQSLPTSVDIHEAATSTNNNLLGQPLGGKSGQLGTGGRDSLSPSLPRGSPSHHEAGTLGLRETIDRAMQSAAGLPLSPRSATSSNDSTGAATWRGVSEEINTSSGSLRVAPAVRTISSASLGGEYNVANITAMEEHASRTEEAFNSYRASRRSCTIS